MLHDCTLVLTSAPGEGAITDAVVTSALEAAGAAGSTKDARWLSPGDAWEVRIEDGHLSRAETLDAVSGVIGGVPVDVNLVAGPVEKRRKRLLTADMESTIIREEMLDEMADLVDCREEISSITAAAMRGEIDFDTSLRRRVALFAGLDLARLTPLHDRVSLMPGAETLVRTLKAHEVRCALVTGGFTLFAEPVAQRLGFDVVAANALEVSDSRLTGLPREPILGPDGKAQSLTRLAAEYGIDLSDALAVGDGANDLAMLTAAGLGVAFRPKPVLADAARASDHGAVVRHGDLTALLYLQGYEAREFAV